MTVSGSFEIHLTLRPLENTAMERLRDLVSGWELKITHIVLSQGQQTSQPMLTFHKTGSLGSVIGEAGRLAAQGFTVCRVKVEVCADHPVAPTNKGQALRRPASWHFEHHIKLLLSSGQSLVSLEKLAAGHGARVSRNALRRRDDGMEERFLTQRFFRQGRDRAGAALDALRAALGKDRLTVLECEAEYVVYDSNMMVDTGWLPP